MLDRTRRRFRPTRRRIRALVAGALTIGSGTGAYVLATTAATADGAAHAAELGAGAVLTALVLAIPANEGRRELQERRRVTKEALDSAEDLRVTMADTLEPLLRVVGEIRTETDTHRRERLRGEAIQGVLLGVAQLIGTQRTRACWFEMEPGPPRRLVSNLSAGRSGKTSHEFVRGTIAGDAALKMVDDGRRLYCPDVNVAPPPGWTGTSSGYQTFVAVSVRAGRRPYGMLTVDALSPGDLAIEEEVGLVDVFANLLGAIASA